MAAIERAPQRKGYRMNTPFKKDDTATELQSDRWVGKAAEGTIVAQYHIRYRQFLDPDGELLPHPPALATDAETLRELYKAMVLARAFDQKAIALQRTGELRTYPSCQGQEAIAVGLARPFPFSGQMMVP